MKPDFDTPPWLATRRQCAIIGIFCATVLCLGLMSSAAQAIERRKPQFPTEPSYLIFPLPIVLPGIGELIVVTGMAGNVGGTHTDVIALWITGDVTGTALLVEDVHLLSEKLILEGFYFGIDKALINNYETRGIDSDPDDFTQIELSEFTGVSGQLTLTFWDRRLEFFASQATERNVVPRIRDKDGKVIIEADPAFVSESKTTTFGGQFDYTDDFNDPREGFRFRISRSNSPALESDDPEFFVWNLAVTGYIPVGGISTVALHYFQSDAEVTREGNTNETAIRAELGFSCASNDRTCLDAEQKIVARIVAERTYGTSTSLGGDERLRAYPGGRFSGAHTVFYAVEYRWNLSEEVTPFDYFIWKDVRTAVQIAFFAETGSVGETRSEVGREFRSAYGVGTRLVTASGFVYRADLATGEEGSELSVVFFYPF